MFIAGHRNTLLVQQAAGRKVCERYKCLRARAADTVDGVICELQVFCR
jgi:hypothetical protein